VSRDRGQEQEAGAGGRRQEQEAGAGAGGRAQEAGAGGRGMKAMFERLNAYRVMWVLVFFDLPTDTKQDRKNYTTFRKKMLADGFQMFQFSIYMRHCLSRENADAHIKKTRGNLPPKGNVGIMCITDRQFGMMEIFHGHDPAPLVAPTQQLELF